MTHSTARHSLSQLAGGSDLLGAQLALPRRSAAQGGAIVVAEAHPFVRDALACLLTDHGYRVLTAQCGDSAYQLLCAEDVGCLVADLAAESVAGVDLVKRVRRDAWLRRVPIVGLARVDGSGAADARRAGADVVLERPFPAGLLLTAVQTLARPHVAAR
jgi:DNA-binding response OmpR family regulator